LLNIPKYEGFEGVQHKKRKVSEDKTNMNKTEKSVLLFFIYVELSQAFDFDFCLEIEN